HNVGGAERLPGSLLRALRENEFNAELVRRGLHPRIFTLLGLPELPYRIIPEPLTVKAAESLKKKLRRLGKFLLYKNLHSIMESEEPAP
ncbi:MAG: hypothetical protein ACP5II_08225, partial [Infirmifilum sp.]|uniref:hypothetical protein n=1 Tax=Infirmifilum sp. TaxID=2856575 RepID=UPI003D0C10C5